MDRPGKFYYHYENNKLVTPNGVPMNNVGMMPQITQGAIQTVNYQLVTGSAGTTKYTGLTSGTAVKLLVDDDYRNEAIPVPLGNNLWTNSSGSEWQKSCSYTPAKVYFDEVEATVGTVESLVAGEYNYASNVLTVRLADSADPAAKSDDFITAKFSQTYAATVPYLEVQDDGFNLAASWWDEDTSAFRDPVIGNGEISFLINANRVGYYMRIGSVPSVTANAEMQFFTAGQYNNTKEIKFICRNRIQGSTVTQLDLINLNVYTKSEVASFIDTKVELPDVIDADALVTIDANGKITNTDYSISAGKLIGPVLGEPGVFGFIEFKRHNTKITIEIGEVT